MMAGCDTFVVLPPLTADGGLIFGKNSDRPSEEVQEVVYFHEKTHPEGEKVKCTYIEIDQVSKTRAVILSKPVWMWGAEMGANNAGVVIGNEAVWTKVPEDSDKKLLGMDLLRLGLERSGSALEAIDVITQLLEKHGQGGPCSDIETDLTYHNSFLIADPSEAWVLETAGTLWAAEKVESGFRNISNCLSITTKVDKMSDSLKTYALDKNLWDGQGDFSFKEAFSDSNCSREVAGKKLLEDLTSGSKFTVESMFQILRDKESGICMTLDMPHTSTGSQVSLLLKDKPSVHWFTATPDPSLSVFKPFVFTPDVKVSHHTVSPLSQGTNPDEKVHNLYKLHKLAVKEKPGVLEQLLSMEVSCTGEVKRFLETYTPGTPLSELDELFKDVVETEVKFYK